MLGWTPFNYTRIASMAGRAMAWMFGRRCVLCLEACDDTNLCVHCRYVIPRVTNACIKCAIPLPVDEPHGICGRCMSTPPPWDMAYAAAVYAPPVDELIGLFKFSHDLAAGRALVALLASNLPRAPSARDSVIIPVPLHVSRLRQRGFNQALELAAPLGKLLGCGVSVNTLIRDKRSDPQSTVAAGQRRRNVKGAFALQRDPPASVILVDDVLTTGSTLAECTRVLLAGGAQQVNVWVAARTLAQAGPYCK